MHFDWAQAYVPMSTYYIVLVLLIVAAWSAVEFGRAHPQIGAIPREILSTVVGLVMAALPAAVLLALYIAFDVGGLPRPAEFLGLVSGLYFYSFLVTVVAGGPLFLLVRVFTMVRWWSASIAGALVGALVAGFPRLNVVDHDELLYLVYLMFAGAVSGLVFWGVWRTGARVSAQKESNDVPGA